MKYIVADGGNAICKCINLLGKEHVYDITHKIAWLLKNTYSNNDSFKKYSKEMAQMRFKGVCSDISHLIPPKQRTDSRFMNLDILSDWGTKALNCLRSSKKDCKICQKLSWVKEYEGLIGELYLLNQLIAEAKATLKTKGLSKETLNNVIKLFKQKQTKNVRVSTFKENLLRYLGETLMKLPKEKRILCTSDIIESSFGKYKNYMSQNSMAGITDLSLCLAAFTNELNPEELKEGLEKVKMRDLREWSKENIGETNFSKRKKALTITRG